MNILPKKSWHVRNKDNVAKVRKDEQEARDQEKERERRISLAEQETRIQLLRQKARLTAGQDCVSSLEEHSRTPTNLFVDDPTAKNVHHEEEKRIEKETQEKNLGVLTYLGQSSVETMNDEEKPWYFKAPSQRDQPTESKDVKRKSSLDPLNDMHKHLSKKKKKKHKKSHKSKQIDRRDVCTTSSTSKQDKLQKMREARLRREKEERLRSKSFLERHYDIPKRTDLSPPSPTQVVPKYNNQFNPMFARNNRSSR